MEAVTRGRCGFRWRDYIFVAARLALKKLLPSKGLAAFRNGYLTATSWLFRGTAVVCPCCGQSARRFLAYGFPLRSHAMCPHCGCLERHRETALFLDDYLRQVGLSRTCLHIAPEEGLRSFLKRHGTVQTITADFSGMDVDVQCDLARLPMADESVDLVICHHVLEHVPDDGRAAGELCRILKPGGILITSVPFFSGCQTRMVVRDGSSTVERVLGFGQEDHVRVYDRGAFAGLWAAFRLSLFECPVKSSLSDAQQWRYGLNGNEVVWIGGKGFLPACEGAG